MIVRKTFWVFLFLTVISVVASIFIRDNIYYRLIYLFVFIIFASWIWSFFSIRGILIRRFVRGSRQQVGEVFDETIEVVNNSKLAKLWLDVREKSPLPGAPISRILSWIGPRSLRTYAIYTLLIRRGEYHLGPTIISSGDPLGLFASQKEIPGEKTLLVLPHLVDLSTFPFPPGLLPGGRALRRRSLEVTPHAASVREYAHGDPLNRIHWSSTARRGQLMVKEFDQDPQADVWIILDSYRYGHVTSSEADEVARVRRNWMWWTQKEEFTLYPSTYEYGVTCAGSIAKYFIKKGQAIGFISAGQIYTILPAERTDRQLSKILETLALLQCEGELPIHGLVESQISYLPRGSTVILITPSVREEVILAVGEIIMRELRPVVVMIDQNSFGSPYKIDKVFEGLTSKNVPVLVVQKGCNIKQSLEKN